MGVRYSRALSPGLGSLGLWICMQLIPVIISVCVWLSDSLDLHA
jgi:hypothetical protein